MNWPRLIRSAHRWVSMAFTLTVIANFAAMPFAGEAGTPPWLYLSPLLPLFLLLFSGVFMFFQPYFARRRAANAVS